MVSLIGTTLRHYRILRALGRGGMGEVYVAEDTRLHREVALKVLPQDTAADPERLQRFQREAQAVAALNHPNVVTIYAVEEAEHLQFITMELVEGATLADMIPERGFDLQEFLRLAAPLAGAIAAAHQRGIVHRDLKPANIMVTTAERRLKVLDFGLAKLKEARSGATDATTLTTATLTAEHAILGTPSYMSPEQAEGRPVDDRTDIFSAGVILYEMATGVRPFKGDSVLSILSSIIKDSPPPAVEANPKLPQELDRIIMRCLDKDPGRRYQSAADLRNDLEALQQQAGTEVGPLRAAARMLALSVQRRGRWAAALGMILLIAAISWLLIGRSTGVSRLAPATVTTTAQLTSSPGVEQYPSLTPDGQLVYYSGWDSGRRHIFFQFVNGQNPVPVTKDPDVDDDQPACSPDGKLVAFRSSRDGGGLFVMGRTGEAVRRLTNIGFNPSWSPDSKKIVFSTENVQLAPMNREGGRNLYTVDVETEELQLLKAEKAVQPSWSPHNKRIAYASASSESGPRSAQMQIWTIPVGEGEPVQVTTGTSISWCPQWSPDGKYLYFASDRGGSMNLWRVPIDEASGKPTGEPEAIVTPATSLAHPAISADGRRIAYSNVQISANIQELPFDPGAGTTGVPRWVTRGSKVWSSCDVSPDGKKLVFYDLVSSDLYTTGTDGTGNPMQLTRDHLDRVPRWSPLGDWIVFFSQRGGEPSLWKIRPDGSGLQQITDVRAGIAAWRSDGSRIAVTGGETGFELDKVFIFDPNRPWREQIPEVLPADYGSIRKLIATSWSPDNEKLAFQIGFNEGGSNNDLGIVTYSFKSKQYERLTDYGEWPVWLPDSRRILCVSNASELIVIDSRSKEKKMIFNETRDRIGPPRMTREGRFIYFTRQVTEADIYLVDLR